MPVPHVSCLEHVINKTDTMNMYFLTVQCQFRMPLGLGMGMGGVLPMGMALGQDIMNTRNFLDLDNAVKSIFGPTAQPTPPMVGYFTVTEITSITYIWSKQSPTLSNALKTSHNMSRLLCDNICIYSKVCLKGIRL